MYDGRCEECIWRDEETKEFERLDGRRAQRLPSERRDEPDAIESGAESRHAYEMLMTAHDHCSYAEGATGKPPPPFLPPLST